MRRLPCLPGFFILLIILCGCVSAEAKAPNSKAQSPISVSISATENSQFSQVADFVVTATAHFNTDDLTVRVQVPAGMQLHTGYLFWRGSANRGQAKTLRFSASFDKQSNQQITATATIQSPSGARFSSLAVYNAGTRQDSTRSLSATPQSPQSTSTQRNGQGVVEYSLPKQ